MPDVKLQPVLEASHPAALEPDLAPLLGAAGRPPAFVSSRLQAPVCYWAVYRQEERFATFKSFFSGDTYELYVDKLSRHYGDRLDRPEHPLGGIRLLPRWNAVLWNLPFDPRMPRLARCFDAAWAGELLGRPANAPLEVKLLNYNPEVGALLAYRDGRRTIAYGKVSADGDGRPAFEVMQALWASTTRSAEPPRSPASRGAPDPRHAPGGAPDPRHAPGGAPNPRHNPGDASDSRRASGVAPCERQASTDAPAPSGSSNAATVTFAQPLAYVPEASFTLQAPAPGRTIAPHRNAQPFLDLAQAAGPALAAIHASGVAAGPERTFDSQLDRLRTALPELGLTAPTLYCTLRDLIAHLEARAGRSTAAPVVPSHGDYKWNQFLAARGRFSLIDFELFCRAEPYLDLGCFCAYLPPASPEDWRDGVAVELLRRCFLRGYQEAAGVALDYERLALYESALLAMRAVSHVWQHQAGWRLQASQLLDLAFDRLMSVEAA